MSYQYCVIHKKVSAWGCPVCRSVELKRGMDEAVKEANRAMRDAFRSCDLARPLPDEVRE